MRYPKWLQYTFLSFFAILVTGLLIYHHYYYQELYLVKNNFERLPGVRVVKIQGYVDEPWMDYWIAVGDGKMFLNPKNGCSIG